jgi:hypothetical protein
MTVSNLNPDPRTGYEREYGSTRTDRPVTTPTVRTPTRTARILSYVSFALAVVALFTGWLPALIGLILSVVAYSMGDRRLGMWAAIANVAALIVVGLIIGSLVGGNSAGGNTGGNTGGGY